MTANDPIQPGIFRHFKGGFYEVLGSVRDSETDEEMVVYRPLTDGAGWWVRPRAMFVEAVLADGVLRPRFQRIEAAEAGSASGVKPS